MVKKKVPVFDPQLVYPCEGTCGRDTRPTSWLASQLPEEFKNTVARAGNRMCAGCYRKSPEVIERKSQPKPDVVLTAKDLDNIRQAEEFAAARKARLARQNAGARLRRAQPVMAGRRG
ncbi:hypothetical protein FDH86_gp059 [Arthrobacter phage Tank]|uniref:Uncharacterized protein n=1 Tax=Arthrobacter phage Tank TaxID=1772319 RepID=A0A0U4K278_9CAUD|nr:hypothetical protein FDH86_gp059 [Arthrobacter phage Tank]ALY10594.1 hypothetical protein TANK_59 [Arthrobacter phage Tank]